MAKTNGAKLFAEIIKGYGLTHVFYGPQVISTALGAMDDMEIRRVVAHSEKAAAYMADGYARARNAPGMCLAQPIGASNLASGLRDAFMARSPVIAISGGPFLGLLGTVVGVMITFAAIAAAGDVNVNAIAPGIAAALLATVAGLGVAIPSLFGYNYLAARIKTLSADMQIFVDEFVTRAAESHGE